MMLGMDKMDGYRFEFHLTLSGLCEMKDALCEFESIMMPNELGGVLSTMLAEQHNLRIDKSNQFARLHALIKIAQETDLDKDVLIACINNYGDLK